MKFTKTNATLREKLTNQVIEIGKRLYQKDHIVGTEGNLSIRLNEKEILITRSGTAKGFLQPGDILVLDMDGKVTWGKGKVSTESPFHLFFYRERPEINALIHAHPPFAIACSLAGISLEKPILPETAVTLGSIPTVPYTTPTTQDLVKAIEKVQEQYGVNHPAPFDRPMAFILERHGAITLGKDLYEAFYLLEILERTAQVALYSLSLGLLPPLPDEEIIRLQELTQKNNEK